MLPALYYFVLQRNVKKLILTKTGLQNFEYYQKQNYVLA